MEIRYVRKQDLEALLTLEEENFPVEEQMDPSVIAFQVDQAHASCLVMEENGEVLGTLLSIPVAERALTDQIFTRHDLPADATFLGITSLSIHPRVQGQGLGTLLLAALKEVAVEGGYQGISLTCHEELIGYYATNGFTDQGESASKLGGKTWYDMTWINLEK